MVDDHLSSRPRVRRALIGLVWYTHTVPRTAKYGKWTQRLHQPLSLQMMEQMKMRSKGSGRAAEAAKAAVEAAQEADTEGAQRHAVRVASKAALMETLALRTRWSRFCEDLGARPAKQDELRMQEGDGCARQVHATAGGGRAGGGGGGCGGGGGGSRAAESASGGGGG